MFGTRKEVVYVSGKISGLERDVYTKVFKDAENRIKNDGYKVVNPCEVVPFGNMEKPTWSDYMRADVAALCRCDKIYMTANWVTSRGALIEKLIAVFLGIKVVHEQEISFKVWAKMVINFVIKEIYKEQK